jgi:hypothetical protein
MPASSLVKVSSLLLVAIWILCTVVASSVPGMPLPRAGRSPAARDEIAWKDVPETSRASLKCHIDA